MEAAIFRTRGPLAPTFEVSLEGFGFRLALARLAVLAISSFRMSVSEASRG